MHDVCIAVLTICGSLLAGLIVAWASFRVGREARRDQRQRDVEAAMVDFFAAITKAVAGRRRPRPRPPSRFPSSFDRRGDLSRAHQLRGAWPRGKG